MTRRSRNRNRTQDAHGHSAPDASASAPVPPAPDPEWGISAEELARRRAQHPAFEVVEIDIDAMLAADATRHAERTPAPPPERPRAATPDPEQLASSRRHDGWTAARQRNFLECLAEGHSVESACRVAGMTHQSAYAFRRRPLGRCGGRMSARHAPIS